MSVIGKFIGFLGKYGDEVLSISTALKAIVSAVPMGKSEKASVIEVITSLEKIPGNLEDAIKGLKSETVIKIERKDVEDAVAKILQPMVDAAIIKFHTED